MSKELETLHTLLVEQYVALMRAGESDPRILKEIRELLKDNSVTGDIVGMVKEINDTIELPEDYMPLELVNNG
jgi:hypothetical protein